ncbi:MAG: AzlC family ABC transporter permease [Burkholderiales bacterium]|nr:MAG: AzlC family ABC transporter permease [Burkholderiales bacterium]
MDLERGRARALRRRDRARALRRRDRAREGLHAVAPALVGFGTWGLVTGVALVKSGLSTAQALGMVLLVFSGTVQLAALPLMATGVPMLLLAATTLLISLRFVLYSAIVARDFRRFALLRRLAFGYFTTDGGIAAYSMRVRPDWGLAERYAFFWSANLGIWAAWQAGSLAGVALAGLLPHAREYDFIGRLAILAILVPMVRTRAAAACAAAAALVAALTAHWPHGLGLFAAVLTGVAGALVVQRSGEAAASDSA